MSTISNVIWLQGTTLNQAWLIKQYLLSFQLIFCSKNGSSPPPFPACHLFQSHGIGRVQYVQPEAVAQVLKAGAAHKHCGLTLRVSNFEYKPQGGDAMRIAAKEEVRKQESAREELHSSISQILDQESSVQDQLIALTEKLSLTWEDFLDRQGIVCKLKEVFTPSHPGISNTVRGSCIQKAC